MYLGPQIRILSGESAGRVVEIAETGLQVSDDFMIRLHDGRAIAYVGTGETQERRSLLDHNVSIRTGGRDFRFEHLEFDPERVRELFSEITPCDPLAAENDNVQNYFIRLIRNRLGRRVRVAVILNSRGPRLLGYGTYYPDLFVVPPDLLYETQKGLLPGVYDRTGRVLCAKLSQGDRCLGILYLSALEGGAFSRQERIEIVRIAGYLSIFLAPFDAEVGIDAVEYQETADAEDMRRSAVMGLVEDRIPGLEKVALLLAPGDRTAENVKFIKWSFPEELQPDKQLVWAAFTSEGGLAWHKNRTMGAIAIQDPERFGRDAASRLGVLYIEGMTVDFDDPEVKARLKEIASVASIYLSNRSAEPNNAGISKGSALAVVSGPEVGKVLSMHDGPVDFGPGGLDDPDQLYRIEKTDKGTLLRVLPEAFDRRVNNVLALIFEKIPATKNAAVFLVEGKVQNKRGNFCAYLRPPRFPIANRDAVVFCFFSKDGIFTSHEGAVCAVAIKDRRQLGKGPEARLGVVYIESANDAAADPDQLTKLKDIAVFASKYLSIRKPSELSSGEDRR